MFKSIVIIVVVAFALFYIGFSIVGIVRDIKSKKRNNVSSSHESNEKNNI